MLPNSLQREETAGVVGVLKQVRRGLVDGNGARSGGRIGRLAAVDGKWWLVVASSRLTSCSPSNRLRLLRRESYTNRKYKSPNPFLDPGRLVLIGCA